MAFDAQFLSAALQEVQALADPRVEKIHQPSRDTVIVHLRHSEGRAKLLIAANPAAPRKTPPSRPCSVCCCASTCWARGW